MEDGGSPLIGFLLFFVFVLLDAICYGFLAAMDNVSESQVTGRVQEGKRSAVWLLRIMDTPYPVTHVIQSFTVFVSVILGFYQGKLFLKLMLQKIVSQGYSRISVAICCVFVFLVMIFVFVTLGILLPQKMAVRKPEKWCFGLAGMMHGLVLLFTPLGFLAEKTSDLFLRIMGMDPNENVDDVTEEEIISMVNEGHEHGVLEASEAEMIHNIFEFGDKDAKDIMTHRKNIVAVEGNMSLSDAMEYMLEKNNSRFPVYLEDIDNIIGVIHIKDAMIQSREEASLALPINRIPGLVREVNFIPETRKISSLFQTMQSQKNHIVIVVDEYGQTAGIVAMEDILEEIVGNILDEYDEEDIMIVEQGDGSYLMRGMAPLEEICDVLNISCDLEDYDTLNGYLISLIDKIPEDNEVFEIQDQGYLFHVLQVENKMIQTVRVLPMKREDHDTAEEQ